MLQKAKSAFAQKLRNVNAKIASHNPAAEQQMQRSIVNQYRMSLKSGQAMYDDIADAGFRCYSEYEEDGIILYLLSMVGMKTKTVVEMCCGDGKICMATNLILNHGYRGFLFDGDAGNVERAHSFYGSQNECQLEQPTISKSWITKGNVNDLIRDAGAEGEVDLLSLDVDGVDYYLWEAIDCISPRVCVFETHNVVPSDLSVTIPYQDDFYAWSKPSPERDFRSVSLLAMKKLSAAKGYTLVGGHRYGFNVFFVRNDLLGNYLKEVTVESVHDNAYTRRQRETLWPQVKDMGWVEV